MRDFVDTTQNAWKAAAGKDVQLQSLYEIGFPYMTIYRYDRVICGDQEFLKDLYWAKQAPRTAQHFQCTGPDNLKVDIINVHAPSSPFHVLKDAHRTDLIHKLLETPSLNAPEIIAHVPFVIGGDLNTKEATLETILKEQPYNPLLQTQVQIHVPTQGHPGDLCFHAGFSAKTLEITAEHHDPKHIPYGIQWHERRCDSAERSNAPQEAPYWAYFPQSDSSQMYAYCPVYFLVEQQSWWPNMSFQAQQIDNSRASSSWQMPVLPQAEVQNTTQQCMKTYNPQIATKHSAQKQRKDAKSQCAEKSATSSSSCQTRREKEMAAMQRQGGCVDADMLPPPGMPGAVPQQEYTSLPLSSIQVKEEEVDLSSLEEEADYGGEESLPAFDPEEDPCLHVAATSAEDPDHLNQMMFCLVRKLVGDIANRNPQTSPVLLEALRSNFSQEPRKYLRTSKFFEDILFHFPHGPHNRSVYKARGIAWYVDNWKKYRDMRIWVVNSEEEAKNGIHFSKQQTKEIFACIKRDLRSKSDDKKSWVQWKSCAQAMIHKAGGNKDLVEHIWTVGLPVPKERQRHLDELQDAIGDVLDWLHEIVAISDENKSTPEYHEAKRKAGNAPYQSGLTEEEKHKKKRVDDAQEAFALGAKLQRRWRAHEYLSPSDSDHLKKFRNKTLRNERDEAQRQRGPPVRHTRARLES